MKAEVHDSPSRTSAFSLFVARSNTPSFDVADRGQEYSERKVTHGLTGGVDIGRGKRQLCPENNSHRPRQ